MKFCYETGYNRKTAPDKISSSFQIHISKSILILKIPLLMNSLLKFSHKLENRETASDKISFLFEFLYQNSF